MKKLLLLLLLVSSRLLSYSQDALPENPIQAYYDSVNATFQYQTGTIKLKGGMATLTVPAGFKYLDAAQSNYVLSTLWGNPESESSLGMLLPANMGPMGDASWVFDIEYEEMGYVKDDDADEIDYDQLLEDMRQESQEANPERVEQGYAPVYLAGWAAAPFYDKQNHILHWAKELKFGDSEENTLNYNVRILGRKGVLVLNAIASMNQFAEVNSHIAEVEHIVEFTDGNRYTDFVAGIDDVAAYTLGGLVAGKVLAKVGFFALLLKFWKIIAFAVVGAGSWLWKRFKGEKNEYVQEEKEINA